METELLNIISDIKESKTGECLYLTENGLNDNEAVVVADALQSNKSLKRFAAFGNRFGEIGGLAFVKVLQANTNLRELGLSSNIIGDKAVIAIAEALASNSTLRELRLSNTGVGDISAVALANALKTNISLSVLRLDRNQIKHIGAIALADTIATHNKTIQSLWLNSNHFGDEGGKAFVRMIEVNSSLKCLMMDNNELTNELGQMMIKAVKANRTLEVLDLDMNKFDAETHKQIKYLMSHPAQMQRQKSAAYVKIMNETTEHQLEMYEIAQCALKNCHLSEHNSEHLLLDNAETPEIKYTPQEKYYAKRNSYPVLEPDTIRAFQHKLANYGVNVHTTRMGLTTSIYSFLKATFFKLNTRQLKTNGKTVKILVCKDQYGFFFKIAKYTDVDVILIDTLKNGKIDINDLTETLRICKAENVIIGFIFSNPINPTQVVYSQEEVDRLAVVLSDNVDVIFDDLTNMDTCRSSYNRRLLSSNVRFESHDDEELFKNILILANRKRSHSVSDVDIFSGSHGKHIGTFIRSSLVRKTIVLWSPGKAYTSACRISCIAIPNEFLDSKLITFYNKTCFAYESQWRIQEFLLNKMYTAPLLCVQHCMRMFDVYKEGLFYLNLALSKRVHIGYHGFVKLKPRKYRASNTVEMDFSGFRSYTIDGKSLRTGVDVFHLLVNNVKTKTIPCEANFISGIEVRCSLGIPAEMIQSFCRRLYDYFMSVEIIKSE